MSFAYTSKLPISASLSGHFCSYVDNQLRRSKRFDAEGIEREYPEFFRPAPRRRTSSSHSLASMTSDASSSGSNREDGQLRYWTSEMCNRNAHLFDFVVTVSTACCPLAFPKLINLFFVSLEATELFFSHHGSFSESSRQSSHSRLARSDSSPTLTLRNTLASWTLRSTTAYE